MLASVDATQVFLGIIVAVITAMGTYLGIRLTTHQARDDTAISARVASHQAVLSSQDHRLELLLNGLQSQADHARDRLTAAEALVNEARARLAHAEEELRVSVAALVTETARCARLEAQVAECALRVDTLEARLEALRAE